MILNHANNVRLVVLLAVCALSWAPARAQPSGTLVGWGYNSHGQRSIPAALQGQLVKSVATGYYHSLVIKADGTLYAWGRNDEPNGYAGHVPVELQGQHFKAIAAGYHHCVALREDGRVFAWGGTAGESEIPLFFIEVKFSAIAAGELWSVAIIDHPGYADHGSLVAWGSPYTCGDGPCPNCQGLPSGGWDPTNTSTAGPGPFVAVSASGHYGLAQRVNGTLGAWGADEQYICQVTNVHAGPVDRFSAGHRHGVVLKFPATPSFWGQNGFGQSQITPWPGGCPTNCVGFGCAPLCYKAPPDSFPVLMDAKVRLLPHDWAEAGRLARWMGKELFPSGRPSRRIIHHVVVQLRSRAGD